VAYFQGAVRFHETSVHFCQTARLVAADTRSEARPMCVGSVLHEVALRPVFPAALRRSLSVSCHRCSLHLQPTLCILATDNAVTHHTSLFPVCTTEHPTRRTSAGTAVKSQPKTDTCTFGVRLRPNLRTVKRLLKINQTRHFDDVTNVEFNCWKVTSSG
jgi:hypothetical protein